MSMTKNKAKMKQHIEAGLDITAPVIWINHLGQEVPATIAKQDRRGSQPALWVVRALDGTRCQSGGGGAAFTFSY